MEQKYQSLKSVKFRQVHSKAMIIRMRKRTELHQRMCPRAATIHYMSPPRCPQKLFHQQMNRAIQMPLRYYVCHLQHAELSYALGLMKIHYISNTHCNNNIYRETFMLAQRNILASLFTLSFYRCLTYLPLAV